MGDRGAIGRALCDIVDGVQYLTMVPETEASAHFQSVCEIQARAISDGLALAGRPMRTLGLAVLSVLGPKSVHDLSHGNRLSAIFVAQGNLLAQQLAAVPPTPQEAVVWWLMSAFNHVRRDAYLRLPNVSIVDWDRMAVTTVVADQVDELTAQYVPADLAFLVESRIADRGRLQDVAAPGSTLEAAAKLVFARRALAADCANFILIPNAEPCTGVVAGIRFAALIACGRRRGYRDRAEMAAAAGFVADSLLNAEPEWYTLQLPPVII